MGNRTKNAARNIIWGILLKTITSVLPFINRTMVVTLLGIEYAGVSSLFSSILSVLSLAELGINSAIVFSMYKTIANRDIKKTNALLALYKKAYHYIGVVVLLLGLLICIKLDSMIAGGYPNSLNIYIVFLIYLFNSVASYLFFAYASVLLIANQREDIMHKVSIISAFAIEVVQVFVLLVFRNYYLFIMITSIGIIFNNYYVYKKSKELYPEYEPKGKLNNEEINAIKKQISGLMIGKISVVSRNQIDNIIISSTLGLVSTGIYGNYYSIMNAVFTIIFLVCSGSKASIGNKVVTNSIEENYKDMLALSFGFYIIYGACTVCLVNAYQPFMMMWMGEKLTASFSLPILISMYFFFYCSVCVISLYWEAAGLFWENRKRYIFEAALNVTLHIVLVQIFGLNGVILSTLISMVFCTNVFGPIIVFKHYFKGCSILNYFKKQIYYTICTSIVSFVCYIALKDLVLGGIIGLLIKCIMCGLFSICVSLIVFSNTNEFNEIAILASKLANNRIVLTNATIKRTSIVTLIVIIITYLSIVIMSM